jgi:hypothetical protein
MNYNSSVSNMLVSWSVLYQHQNFKMPSLLNTFYQCIYWLQNSNWKLLTTQYILWFRNSFWLCKMKSIFSSLIFYQKWLKTASEPILSVANKIWKYHLMQINISSYSDWAESTIWSPVELMTFDFNNVYKPLSSNLQYQKEWYSLIKKMSCFLINMLISVECKSSYLS